MKKRGRYDTSGLVEDCFEPGSRGRVLKNRMGIISRRVIDEIEAREQLRALNEFLEIFERDHSFTAKDICRMHEVWLGNIYEWAGRYRQVNISKGGFTFAVARQVPQLMEKFEKGPLREFTPCLLTGREEIIHAVAVVHTELVLFILSEKAMAVSPECWQCSWDCRLVCRLLISATSREGSNKNTSLLCRPAWIITTPPWRVSSGLFLFGHCGRRGRDSSFFIQPQRPCG